VAQRRSATDQVVLAAMRLVMGISVQAADEVGVVSAVQLRAVTVLSQRPGSNLGELAQALGVSVSVTSRLVDRLVSAGLAEKRPSATSGREISLWVSREGQAVLERYDELRLDRIRARLRELPAEDAAAVVTGLQALVDGPGRDRARPGPRSGP
jgi:DNA-binding MarR family transcriptional regulator